MINIYTALAQAVGAADKVMKWIAREPLIRPPPPAAAAAPASCRGDLKLNNVNFRYALRPEQPVLRGLSLHVAPGEVVALCGPSGGGKSSIISLLERLYEPESGEVTGRHRRRNHRRRHHFHLHLHRHRHLHLQVLLDDMPLSSLDPRWFHRQVALVAQEPVLFARTIEENITYGLENGGGGGGDGAAAPGSEEVVRAARLANAHDFIGTFEHAYETVVGERGTQLSGGQKQRVAIARALVRRPAVLLLDEATSALDAESEAVVQAAIDSMIEQGGMTVLVVAHRLSTIRNADRIVIISAGAVKESGKHDELLALKGEYANLVARQMHSSSRGELEQMGRGK